MNKKELISRVTELLHTSDIRKPVKLKDHKFQITDQDGNTANFKVKRADKRVLYTVEDVANIIDACIDIILESIKNGEALNIRGFGILGLHYRAARRTKNPGTEDWVEIDAHYTPKFFAGNDLKAAAKAFDLSKKERDARIDAFDFDAYDDEDGDC